MKRGISKKLKKASIVCLSLAIGFTTTISASAVDQEDITQTTISEYQIVKLAREELKKNPKKFKQSEVDQLENYEDVYQEHIDEINTLTDEQLENLDYDTEQIKAIRDYDGSERMMERSSANVTLTLSKNSSSYTKNRSNLNVFAKFTWNGTPAYQFNDAFGVTNGELMYFSNLNNPFSTTYRSPSGSQKSYSGTLRRQGNGNTGTTTTFPILKYELNGKHYLKSGSANIPMYRDAKVKTCGVGISYGHSYALPTISISIAGSGPSVGIGYSKMVSRKDTNKVFTIY